MIERTTTGDLIAIAMRRKGWILPEAAARLEITEKYLRDLLADRLPVSAYVAVRLQQHLGVNAQLLLVGQVMAELQTAWEEYKQPA